MSDCVFCRDLPKVLENELAYAVYDINPVGRGHTLIIPRRHVEQIFEVTPQESAAIKQLILGMKAEIEKTHDPDGYNIWINSGKAAGQIVMHAHVHLIPRFHGEVLYIKEHLKGNIQ